MEDQTNVNAAAATSSVPSTTSEVAENKPERNERRGRKRQKKWGNRRGAKKRSGDDSEPPVDWRDTKFVVNKENRLFEAYYKGLGIIPESEWEQFLNTLKNPLETTFRINQSDPAYAHKIRDIIQNHFCESIAQLTVDGEKVPPPQPLAWYPDNMAWHIPVSRSILRKNPVLKKLHRFLITETEQGYLSRQEAVSMIPAFFMDIQPHHKILDVCAAPGSKTAQLLEMLYSSHLNSADQSAPDAKQPISGFVVANDADQKRCYLLVHQLQRLCGLFPYALVTNQDATQFPNLELNNGQQLKFDRILCDVVCSGDGTMRKAPDMWKRWVPGLGKGLHTLQIRIAMRAAQMLNIGGRLVYSTCSLNPIEDEAVVAEILRLSKGALELMDVSDVLPQLKYSPGVTSWKVMDKRMKWFSNMSDVEADPNAIKIIPSMFPPTEEEAASMNLHRTMRILPHLQNTGGFYIAVFKKLGRLPNERDDSADELRKQNQTATETATASTSTPATEDADGATANPEAEASADGNQNANRKPGARQGRVKKYLGKTPLADETFAPVSADLLNNIRDFYGFDPSFDFGGRMLARAEKGESRRLFLVSENVRDVVLNNCEQKKWTIINAGVRAFESANHSAGLEQGLKCLYRITQEVVPLLFQHMNKRVVKINLRDFVLILDQTYILFDSLTDERAKQQLREMDVGGCVLQLDTTAECTTSSGAAALTPAIATSEPLVIAAFRATASVTRLVKTNEVVSIKNRIGITSPDTQSDEVADENTADAAEANEEAEEDVEEDADDA